jgi:dTDP-4-amino-4,6-dideoxygalactose transaminase/nucleoside-diphosphate-sugar epimerase/acyl-CoA-binding protein
MSSRSSSGTGNTGGSDNAGDENASTRTKMTTVESLFDKVVQRIRSSDSSTSISTDTKLRLYGLYKYCTVGRDDGEQQPTTSSWSSWTNPTHMAKQRAWHQACQKYDTNDDNQKQQAMVEYVTLAASLDSTCQTWLEEYYKEKEQNISNKKEQQEETLSSSNGMESVSLQDGEPNSNTPIAKSNAKSSASSSSYNDNATFRSKPETRIHDTDKGSRSSSWLSLLLQFVEYWIPGILIIQPVIPRGDLDLSWADLWFAFMACCCRPPACWFWSSVRRQQVLYDHTVEAIQDLWKKQEQSKIMMQLKLSNKDDNSKNNVDSNSVQVVVGYSVRSLLDLYLMHQRYPPRSQVIVIPPINIPGMIQIMEHYGLLVAPIDTSSPTQQLTHDVMTKVQTAITPQTVAIMVVHPFGATTASDQQFQQLRCLADQHQLELWEDAAESYCGIQDFSGSPHAHLTLISFGLIKTATALGGGIALIRHKTNRNNCSNSTAVAAAMQRLQYNHPYRAQTTREYLQQKVFPAMLVQFFSQSPMFYGCLVQACLAWGGYDFFDHLVTHNVRSIKPSTTTNNSNIWLQSIRKRPSLPLVQMMHRRFLQSQNTSQWVQRRIQQCQEMNQILQDNVTPHHHVGLVVNHPPNSSTYWLYPIQLPSDIKRQVQKLLLQRGWDVAAGTSQLQCVLPTQTTTTDPSCSSTAAPSQMQTFMKNVLYLPVASRRLSRDQCIDLAQQLQWAIATATANTKNDTLLSRPVACSRRRKYGIFLTKTASSPLVLLWMLSAWWWRSDGTSSSVASTLWFVCFSLLPKLTLLAWYGTFLMVCLAYGLQWFCGTLYLQSSTGFATYNSIINAILHNDITTTTDHPSRPKIQEACTSANDSTTGASSQDNVSNNNNSKSASRESRNDSILSNGDADCQTSNVGVIASMPSLQLPCVGSSSQDGPSSEFQGCAILTGATGFIGSLLLRDLLLHRMALNLTAGVILICRAKRRRRYQSAQERIDQILQHDMFSFLTNAEKEQLVQVIEGDVNKPRAGLSDDDYNWILSLPNRNIIVTHVIHSAASVSFTQTLADAAQANIMSALTMQALTSQIQHAIEENKEWNLRGYPKPKFVHLSTAFVHGCHVGTPSEPLPERLFSLEPYKPAKLYESMLGTQFYASKAMSDLRFHNTYAFTKCVCEHLLMQQSKQEKVPTIIIRPSIVGPSLENPMEGWAGQKPSTIVAAGCLYLSYQWNLWCLGSYNAPCIPVDVLTRFVLVKAFQKPETESDDNESMPFEDSGNEQDAASLEDSFERVSSQGSLSADSKSYCSSMLPISAKSSHNPSDQGAQIYTAAWDTSSASDALFTWFDYCGVVGQLGSVMGYFNRPTAYIGLWVTEKLVPRLHISIDTYERIHYVLVRLPMLWMLTLCHFFGWKVIQRNLSKLNSFLDLPLLFFPYMNGDFHFQSELVAPQTMSGSRYVFICIVASYRFLETLKTKGKASPVEPSCLPLSAFPIGGSQYKGPSGLWWAMSQPNGSILVRMAGWLFAMILQATCHAVTVDVASFEPAIEARMRAANDNDTVHLVLAPTHRSFFDFVLMSFLCFSLPELHIDIPVIAAADDFEQLPFFGWLARCLGAFYLRRGRGIVDQDLQGKLISIKRCGATTIEVFIEGTRSRDRRFMAPKTGFLRSLSDSGGKHLVVPVAISYERLPEQDILVGEADSTLRKSGLNVVGLFSWLQVRKVSFVPSY